MTVWLTPQQIASMRLAGMPTHEVSIRRMCQKNLLAFRSKERGKGIEISLDSLPIEAQRDYYARFAQSSAPGGELIQAGACPLPAHTSPAATGAGGLTGGGGAGCAFVPGGGVAAPAGYPMAASATAEANAGNGPLTRGAGSIPAAPATVETSDAIWVGMIDGRTPRDDDFERVQAARDLMLLLKPLLDLPERHRGRRAMAEEIARALGKSVAQVYRLAEVAREGGVLALARLGQRRDRGQARVLISAQWQAWAQEAAAAWGGMSAPELADGLRQVVRSAWVGGAPSERQCWLKATAKVAKDWMAAGMPAALASALMRLPAPRRWLAAEGRHHRVAGRFLRDAKGFYDKNRAPVQRTAAGLQPGEVVCGDITPLDIPVLREDGSTGYARIIMWHDVATNWLHHDLVLLDKGEGIRRDVVAASFARMCEQAPFGSPRRLYLDNGSEYRWDEMLVAAKRLADLTEQRFAAEDAASAAGERRVVRSIPFHPRGKRVEGQFGNLRHWLAWWMGYVGGNRMTKKVTTLGKGVQPARFEEVRAWLEATLADYHATPQPGAEHMGGMSPQQKLEAALEAGWKPWKMDRLTLALAFADLEERVVSRGTVQVRGRTYYADFLMGIEGRVTVAVPRILAPAFEAVYILDGQRILGWAEPERVYGLLDEAGAKEAARRAKAARVLMAEKIEAAGGPLDETETAGVRAGLLVLDETIQRAEAAAEWVEPNEEVRRLQEGMRRAEAALIAQINARHEARQHGHISRFGMEDDPETRLAREMGL